MILVLRGIGRHDTGPPYSRIVLAAIPLRGFGSAKTRLADSLSPAGRARLAAAVAERVASACSGAGWSVAVVSASADVMAWCTANAIDLIPDPGGGLDAAASAAIAHAGSDPWALVHGDLPLLSPADLEGVATRVASGTTVLAPSRDGGTNLIAGTGHFAFAYGPGSFVRHIAAAAGAAPLVLIRTGLAVELDTPADLHAVRHHPAGAWLDVFLS